MSRQHYGEDHSTNNNTARCCAATRRGLAAGCDWPVRTTIATLMIGNDERGYAEAIGWVAEHAPGPRVVVGLEGTRSYGIGLARVLQAAGLTVVEIERPRRGERRRGNSDPIDAHLAALHALRLDADRLPRPRADGDRERRRPSAVSRRPDLRPARCHHVPPRRSARDPRTRRPARRGPPPRPRHKRDRPRARR